MRILTLIFLGFWLSVLGESPVAAQSPAAGGARIALVIGVSNYGKPGEIAGRKLRDLPNAARDAELIWDKLRSVGFDVGERPLLDPTKLQLEAGLREFRRKSQTASVALIYFGGHGSELGGQGYVMPSGLSVPAFGRDGELAGVVGAIKAQSVEVQSLADALKGQQANILILNACRTDIVVEELVSRSAAVRSIVHDPALAVQVGVSAPNLQTSSAGMMVAFAATKGFPAYDGSGANSPYATALANALDESELDLYQMFGRVEAEVYKATNARQLPSQQSSMAGRVVYLNPVVAQGRNWIKTANKPCLVHNPNPQQDEFVTWTGQCRGGFAEGAGSLQWTVNGRFSSENVGTWRQGHAEGAFTSYSYDGSRTEGTMNLGKWDGYLYKYRSGGNELASVDFWRNGNFVKQAGLEFCNMSSKPARFAFAYWRTEKWTSTGWYNAQAGQCVWGWDGPIADLNLYVYAENSDHVWREPSATPDGSFCVTTNAFSIVSGAPCAERAARFGKLGNDGIGVRWTIKD